MLCWRIIVHVGELVSSELQPMPGHSVGYPLHVLGYICVDARQADLATGRDALTDNAEFHHA